MSPFGARTKIATVWLFAFEYSTQPSTIARAASALICIFVIVRFAASPDSVTFESGAGVAPCAQTWAVTNANAAASTTVLLFMFVSLDRFELDDRRAVVVADPERH